MTAMILLMGEQPAPNLPPARHLHPETVLVVHTARTRPQTARFEKLLIRDGTSVLPYEVDAYEIETIRTAIRDKIDELGRPAGDLVFNLTGGTKSMAFAAYDVAQEMRAPFLYFQTEGRVSRIYRYSFDDAGHPFSDGAEEVPETISLDDYLRLYLGDFVMRGRPNDNQPGNRFEAAAGDALEQNGFEVMSRVCPARAGNLEIDHVFRGGNQIGVMECKGKFGRSSDLKEAIDQLVAMAGREYLGTYVARFLLTNRPLDRNNLSLCLTHNVTPIVLANFTRDNPTLTDPDRRTLLDAVRKRMGLDHAAKEVKRQ